MEGDDDDSTLCLDEHVDDDQPTPRTDDRSAIPPEARELLAGTRELLQSEQRACDALPRVCREMAALNQRPKLITRLARDLDSRHRLELVERNRFPAPSLLDRFLSPLPSPRDPVENFSDPRGIRISFIKRAGKKRASQSPLLDMRALCQASQLARIVRLKGDIDSTVRLGHWHRLHGMTQDVQRHPLDANRTVTQMAAPRTEPR